MISRANAIGTNTDTSGYPSSSPGSAWGDLSCEKLMQPMHVAKRIIPKKWAMANFSLKNILKAKAVMNGVRAKRVKIIEKFIWANTK